MEKITITMDVATCYKCDRWCDELNEIDDEVDWNKERLASCIVANAAEMWMKDQFMNRVAKYLDDAGIDYQTDCEFGA